MNTPEIHVADRTMVDLGNVPYMSPRNSATNDQPRSRMMPGISPRLIGLCCALASAILLSASESHGQSINIDFGDGAGKPFSCSAGAGLPGVWNMVTDPVGVPTPLVDVNGNQTSVTVERSLGEFFIHAASNPVPLPDGAIMNDGIWGQGDLAIPFEFTGLAPGTYEVIAYVGNPEVDQDVTRVGIVGGSMAIAEGGLWTGEFIQGDNYIVLHADIADGTLSMWFAGTFKKNSFSDGSLNAIQLRLLCPADLNDDGVVDGLDLLLLLSAWDTPDGDLNGDGTTDGLDLLILLSEWGACPGASVCSGPLHCPQVHDSGATTGAIGAQSPAVVMMLQRFDNDADNRPIARIVTTFGSPQDAGFSCIQAGSEFGWAIYGVEPDGSPGAMIASGIDVVDAEAIETDVLQDVSVPHVVVPEEFFVGVYLKDEGGACFDLPYDGSLDHGIDIAWVALELADSVHTVDPASLNQWTQSPVRLSDAVPEHDGVWMLGACTQDAP